MEMEYSPLIIAIIALAVVIVAVIIGVMLWQLKKLLSPREELFGMTRADIAKRWQSIQELVARNDEISAKLAVMEADKLLDHALKAKYFSGNTLGERLKVACYKYPRLKAVWPAHLTRNRLVHEANFHLSPGAARDAIRQFHLALKELGVLS